MLVILQVLNKSVQIFSNIIPLTQGIKLIKIVSIRTSESVKFPIMILLTIGVMCSYFPVKFFKYEIK